MGPQAREKGLHRCATTLEERQTGSSSRLFTIIQPWVGDTALSWLVQKVRQAGPDSELDRELMPLLARELDDPELQGLLVEGEEEVDEFDAFLEEELVEETDTLLKRKREEVNKALWRRFVRVLKERGKP